MCYGCIGRAMQPLTATVVLQDKGSDIACLERDSGGVSCSTVMLGTSGVTVADKKRLVISRSISLIYS